MGKLIKAAALLGLLSIGILGSGKAARSSGEKLQVIYRAQPNGEWQVFLFGLNTCNHDQNMQVIYPKDTTQPVEVECDNTPRPQ